MIGEFVGNFIIQMVVVILGLAAAGMVAWTIAFVLMFAFKVWVLVAIWRCAFNVNWVGWGYLARMATVLSFAGWIAISVLVISTI